MLRIYNPIYLKRVIENINQKVKKINHKNIFKKGDR